MKSRGSLRVNKIEGIELDMSIKYDVEMDLEEMKFLWNAQKEVPEVVEDFVRKIWKLKKELIEEVTEEVTEIEENITGGENYDEK